LFLPRFPRFGIRNPELLQGGRNVFLQDALFVQRFFFLESAALIPFFIL
jgi:hypothetical protein